MIMICQKIPFFIIVMPPKMFNFFNTLIPEDDRINDIINISNIIKYLTKMSIFTPSQLLLHLLYNN